LEAVTNARKDVLTIVAMAENKGLAEKLDKALEGDAARLDGALNEASGIIQTSDDVAKGDISKVNLYQGSETDNAMGGYAAAYDQDGKEIYFNTQGTDISKGGDIITSLFWEAQRKDNTTNGLDLNAGQQLTLASSRGEQAGNLWNRFSETANTGSTNVGGIVNWNNANASSSTLIKGTEKANSLKTGEGSEVVPRSNTLMYARTVELYDKKGIFGLQTERVDKGDAFYKDFVEVDLKNKLALGIKTDFNTVKEEYLKNNPDLQYPYELKEGQRLVTSTRMDIDNTTLGKVMEYWPDGKIGASFTVGSKDNPTGIGTGMTGSFYFTFDADSGAKFSIDESVTTGINIPSLVTVTAGLSYGDPKTAGGSIGGSYNHIAGGIDFGDKYIGVQLGGSSSKISGTLSVPLNSNTWDLYTVDNSGTEKVLKSEQKRFINEVKSLELSK
ncbi:MAG: hypothetical protein CVV49_19110, partial [Spirochaetae bacterium HGW-Spirochaetae-5]